MPNSQRLQQPSPQRVAQPGSRLARIVLGVLALCLLTQLTACGTLSRLLGIERKRSVVVCEDTLMQECEFSDFSGLIDTPLISADLAGSIAVTTKLEADRCALLHKQLINCVKESK